MKRRDVLDAGRALASAQNVELVHVPYRGGGPATADFVAGHVHTMFGNAGSTLPFVRKGSIRAMPSPRRGAEMVGGTPEECANFMAQDAENIGGVVRDARIRVE